MEYGILALLALAILAAGPASLFLALTQRKRILALEERARRLTEIVKAAGLVPEAGATQSAQAQPFATPPAAEKAEPAPSPEPEPEPEPTSFDEAIAARKAAAASTELPAATAPAQAPAPASRDIEEKLGARWAVWVGGVALALGGVLLARYSIEQGHFGPGMRMVTGALFALALVAAGEWLRRRETALNLPGIPSAHIPGVLTAAGTTTAFATVYAAHALYDFIGPGLAFVLLGAIAVATMVAAALHGPALAGLGLVGALGAPMLVSSASPQAWPLVVYLAFVAGAAYGVARMRLWRWLALATVIGVCAWGFLLAEGIGSRAMLAIAIHALIQTMLAGAFLVADPHRATPDEAAAPDWFATGALAALAVIGVFAGALVTAGWPRAIFTGAAMGLHLALAFAFAPAALAGLAAAGIGAAMLWFWPVARLSLNEPATTLPGAGTPVPQPEALSVYLLTGIAAGLALVATGFLRLLRGRTLPPLVAGFYALFATIGPLVMLALAYWRVTDFTPSVPFALGAGLLGATYVAIAARFRALDDGTSGAWRIALGASAAATVAALSLGLAFVLDKGMLTVAVALAALGTAWVARTLAIPGLRYVVGAVALVVVARVVWDPGMGDGDVGTTPIFNWLLWGYGVPAVAFALSARMLSGERFDTVARLCEGLAILFGALLFVFQIRHLIHDGDPFALASGHLDMGLVAAVGLAFSILMVRLDGLRPDPLYRYAGLAFGALTLAVVGAGLLVLDNPLLTDEAVPGGAFLNTLVPAYLLPAALAGLLVWFARATRPDWYIRAAGGLALALSLAYALLAVRRAFQGELIGMWRTTSQPELWTYSAVLLAIGIAFLAVGLLRDIRLARLASAPYIVLAVVKVFLIDMANLDGALRALSFIGLGLTLVGIGLAYQKLLARGAPPAPPAAEPPAAAST